MRRWLLGAFMFVTVWAGGVAVSEAVACPMCQVANESQDDAVPRAYMYSILFMLAMPATLLAGFGIGFYRLSKQQSPTVSEDVDAADDLCDAPSD